MKYLRTSLWWCWLYSVVEQMNMMCCEGFIVCWLLDRWDNGSHSILWLCIWVVKSLWWVSWITGCHWTWDSVSQMSLCRWLDNTICHLHLCLAFLTLISQSTHCNIDKLCQLYRFFRICLLLVLLSVTLASLVQI